jgi:hypothetical protein
MAQSCTRLMWPTGIVYGVTVTVNTRTYVKGPGVFDCLNADVAGLVAAGAISVMLSGAVPAYPPPLAVNPAAPQNAYCVMPEYQPGGNPPVPTDPNRPVAPSTGTLYLDAMLLRAIVWDGTFWRDSWNGASV